jgi:hypothetical protein
MTENTIVKSIRMLPRTLSCVERLQEKMRSPSFSDTVKCAIELSDLIVTAVKSGDRVLIETKKGNQREVLLSGLNG